MVGASLDGEPLSVLLLFLSILKFCLPILAREGSDPRVDYKAGVYPFLSVIEGIPVAS